MIPTDFPAFTLFFFPLVGAAVGAAFWGTDALCRLLELGTVLRAALLAAVPALMIVGVLLALFQRLKEISKGEVDDAKKY